MISPAAPIVQVDDTVLCGVLLVDERSKEVLTPQKPRFPSPIDSGQLSIPHHGISAYSSFRSRLKRIRLEINQLEQSATREFTLRELLVLRDGPGAMARIPMYIRASRGTADSSMPQLWCSLKIERGNVIDY